MHQQLPVMIVVLPLITSLVLSFTGFRYKGAVSYPAVAVLCTCLLGAVYLLVSVIDSGPLDYRLGGWAPPFGIAFRVDALACLMLVLITFLGTVCALWAKKSVEKELPGQGVLFWALYLLLMTGLSGMIVTGDLFNLFVLLEVASLTSYALVGAGSRQGTVAGFRYLMIGTVGACFYLLGVGYLYMATGTLNMGDLARLLPDLYGSRTVVTAFVFIVTGFAIKIALFPLHAWQPDAYTFAPSAVTLIISTAVAKTFVYAMIRVIFSVFTLSFVQTIMPAFQTLAWLGGLAILTGSLFAIVQDDLKRMLAYSSVANVGYIVLGVGLSVSSSLGLTPAVMHMVNHGVIKGAMFMAACGFIHQANLRKISQFTGLSMKMPYSVLILVLASLSMVGLPPGAGFVSKWYLIRAAVDAGQYLFVAIIFISTLLMLVYFWRLIETMYIRPTGLAGPAGPAEPGKSMEGGTREVPLTMLLPGLAMAFLTFILGLLWISGVLFPLVNQINLDLGLGALGTGRLP